MFQLSVATTIIIFSAHLKITFMANISVSLCELYNSQPALCSQFLTVCTYKYYDTKTVSTVNIITDANQINKSPQFHVCKTKHKNIHQKPRPPKSTQNVAHLRFTLLWYTNCISFQANDILFIMNTHICFYFDRSNTLFEIINTNQYKYMTQSLCFQYTNKLD